MGTAIAGMKPLVEGVSNQMPRIAEALETLAGITAKLENNAEDHKRLHFRISSVEETVKKLESGLDELEKEHIQCITTQKVERRVERTSWWAKAKAKAAEKAVELVTLAVVAFCGWLVVSHLKEYPKTAQYFTGKEQKQPVETP